MSITVNSPRDTTLKELNYQLSGGIELDGTASGYKKAMRKYFLMHGAEDATSEELTALCDDWYQITRDEWNGYVEFYQPDTSAVTYGTKGGDNASLSCTPSTDTTEGADDYAGLPLFACVDCNWEMYTDDDGNIEPLITAIDGITSNFQRTNPDVLVGVLQMSGWHYWSETSTTYTHGYSATRSIPAENIEPLAEAVKQDGTIREWVVHPKYMAHLTDDNKLTSCAGVIPTTYLSHNAVHTYSANNGDGYSGTCACDDAFIKLMAYIKYGSLTLDGILQGCVANNYEYPVEISETGVKRLIVTTAEGAYYEVGENVEVGAYASSTDRASLTDSSIYKITKIEEITIDEVTYDAVYVDADETFDTVANGTAVEGTTYMASWHWDCGKTDTVLGNDGSPTSNTSGKYPCKIQGIEMMNGCYEIIADTILSLYLGDDEETYYYEPYVCDTRANQSTSITTNYEASGAQCEQPSEASWNYIRKLSLSGGVMFPIDHDGGSSSTYTRDAIYQNAETTGTREWLARGGLSVGVGLGGLSFVNGLSGLSASSWGCGARLSASGNRGEFVA